MVSTLAIICMWAATIAGIFGLLYFLSEVCFHWFLVMLGAMDRVVQDRHWHKLQYQRLKDENGKEWYVGYRHDDEC